MLVLTQFVGLLLDKVFDGLVPLRFLSFALVGTLGVLVNLVMLVALRKATGLAFETEVAIATLVAMVFNFELNNADDLSRSAAARPQAMARAAAVHAGMRGRGNRQYRHRPDVVRGAYTVDGRRSDRCGDRRGMELRRVGHAGVAGEVTKYASPAGRERPGRGSHQSGDPISARQAFRTGHAPHDGLRG